MPKESCFAHTNALRDVALASLHTTTFVRPPSVSLLKGGRRIVVLGVARLDAVRIAWPARAPLLFAALAKVSWVVAFASAPSAVTAALAVALTRHTHRVIS